LDFSFQNPVALFARLRSCGTPSERNCLTILDTFIFKDFGLLFPPHGLGSIVWLKLKVMIRSPFRLPQWLLFFFFLFWNFFCGLSVFLDSLPPSFDWGWRVSSHQHRRLEEARNRRPQNFLPAYESLFSPSHCFFAGRQYAARVLGEHWFRRNSSA